MSGAAPARDSTLGGPAAEVRRRPGWYAPATPVRRNSGGTAPIERGQILTPSTYLVTGGAGFIGSNFVRQLLRRGGPERVVVFDKLTYAGNLDSLVDVAGDPRFVFVLGDIAERDAVRAALAEHRPDAILNFAAESHVDRSIDGPGEFVRTNIHGTFELLEAARHLVATWDAPRREAFRFLHVSTDEVYGSLGAEGLFREDTPYAPNSPYAASKAAADHLVRAYHETYGLPTLITNCSNNYGPYQFPEKLVPLMILNALEGKPLPIYGDGSNVRDWIHVEDHCAGVLLALEGGRPGRKYNLGGGNERTNLQMVDALCAALEAARPARDNAALRAQGIGRYGDLKKHVRDRPGHDHRYAIDATRASQELGWSAARTFEEGVAETVDWYLTHSTWCENVQSGNYRRERLGLDGPIAGSVG
jgi:dTDP-glucose 4,6-dehydratase